MQNFTKIIVGLAIVFILTSLIFSIKGCTDDENEMKEPPKLTHENSVEYYVTTTKDSAQLIITTKKDIYSNFKLLSSTITKDTLPNIGVEQVTIEDSTGTEVKTTVPKAYDIYFKSERK